jgi:hypothetical protein
MAIQKKPVAKKPAKKAAKKPSRKVVKKAVDVKSIAAQLPQTFGAVASDKPKSLLAMAFEMADRGEAPAMPPRVPKVAAKPRAWRSEDYKRLVSMLPCSLPGCRAPAPSQVAHRNEGKGIGLKVTDAWVFSACPTCHARIDQGGDLPNEQRRGLANEGILRTLSMLLNRGWLFTARPEEAERIMPPPVDQLQGGPVLMLGAPS